MKLAIIGAGPGGYVAALRAVQSGAEAIVIEDIEVGGTCLNRGCIPTKALLACTELYAKSRELDRFGLELEGTISPNLAKMMARKDKIVDIQVKGLRGLFKSGGVELLEGHGSFLSSGEIEVTRKDGSKEKVKADKVIIATGSRPAQIPAFPIDGSIILSSDDALKLMSIPRSMIIVGAGVIGCEWACIFRDLGTEITMVEMLPRAVSTEDTEVSDLLAKEFRKKKIKLLTGTGVENVDTSTDGVTAKLSNGEELKAEKMLVSIGRSFNTGNIGLDRAGIETGKHGEILTNDKMETNVPGIYAVGDVTGGTLLAHTASSEGTVAAVNACSGDVKMDYNTIPAAIFTSPEIGSVGLREHQAEGKGIKIKPGHFQFRSLGKAHALGKISGFVKLLADTESDRLIGAHIIGAHASDLIHECALAIRNNLTITDITKTIHAHPTLSEGILEAAEDIHGGAIHIPMKKKHANVQDG
jgi:dihydrolipoamide dehydrogenase